MKARYARPGSRRLRGWHVRQQWQRRRQQADEPTTPSNALLNTDGTPITNTDGTPITNTDT